MHQKQQHIVTTSIWLHQGLIVDDGVWSALFLAFTFWSASKTTMDFITSPLLRFPHPVNWSNLPPTRASLQQRRNSQIVPPPSVVPVPSRWNLIWALACHVVLTRTNGIYSPSKTHGPYGFLMEYIIGYKLWKGICLMGYIQGNTRILWVIFMGYNGI